MWCKIICELKGMLYIPTVKNQKYCDSVWGLSLLVVEIILSANSQSQHLWEKLLTAITKINPQILVDNYNKSFISHSFQSLTWVNRVQATQAVIQESRFLFFSSSSKSLKFSAWANRWGKRMRYFCTQKLAYITSTHIPLSKNETQVHAKKVWKMYSHFLCSGRRGEHGNWSLVSVSPIVHSLEHYISASLCFPCIGHTHSSSRKATQIPFSH